MGQLLDFNRFKENKRAIGDKEAHAKSEKDDVIASPEALARDADFEARVGRITDSIKRINDLMAELQVKCGEPSKS